MIVEILIQEYVVYLALVVFLFISPVINIIYVPRVIQETKIRRTVFVIMLIIYLILLVLLYWSVFIKYG
jgi:hypothetical protein